MGRPLRPRAACFVHYAYAIEIIGLGGECFSLMRVERAFILFTLRRALGARLHIRCTIIGEECVEAFIISCNISTQRIQLCNAAEDVARFIVSKSLIEM